MGNFLAKDYPVEGVDIDTKRKNNQKRAGIYVGFALLVIVVVLAIAIPLSVSSTDSSNNCLIDCSSGCLTEDCSCNPYACDASSACNYRSCDTSCTYAEAGKDCSNNCLIDCSSGCLTEDCSCVSYVCDDPSACNFESCDASCTYAEAGKDCTDSGDGCDSAAIAADNNYNCFAPAEHILGSFALQNALQRDIESESDSNMSTALKEIDEDRILLYAVGSAAVAPCGNGGDCDDNNGKCYQIRVDPGSTKAEKEIDIIMQSVNTGLTNSFDIFQAQGGAGAFGGEITACDIIWGTGPADGDDSNFWTLHLQNSDLCDGCGNPGDCSTYFDFVDPPKAYMKDSLIESCRVAVDSGVACPNWESVKSLTGQWREVKCPYNLTEVSGLRRTDETTTNYPTSDDNDEDWLGTDTWGTMDDVLEYEPNSLGDDWIDPDTGKFDDDLQITQMMDCRSPEASQNFRNWASSTNFTDNYYDYFDFPSRTASFNINVNGDLITKQGYHGCNILSPTGSEWIYPTGDENVSGVSQYQFGNCPSAFPPDSSYCVRYTNTQECGRRVDRAVPAGEWDPQDTVNWDDPWSNDDECDDGDQMGIQIVYKGDEYTTTTIGDYGGFTDPMKANQCYWKNCPGYLGGGSTIPDDDLLVFPSEVPTCSIPQNDKIYV